MSKVEMLARMKGFLGALLVLSLGVLLIIPWTSSILRNGEGPFMHDMTIYALLLVVWIILAIAFGIIYLASEGGKALRPVTLPGRRKEMLR